MNMMPCSAILIIGPVSLWLALVAPRYIYEISVIPPLLMCIFTAASITNLLLAYLTEPGILPTEEKDVSDVESRRTVRQKQVMVSLKGRYIPLKSFRAKMCRQTNNCVENFDHFCPWVGNVVGRRNYKFFVGFVFFTSLVALTCSVSSAYVVVKTNRESANASMSIVGAATLLTIYSVLILCCVGGLLCFHVQLISTNRTTNEEIKRTYRNATNPHNKGCCANCSEFLLTPTRPSYVCDNPDDGHLNKIIAELQPLAQDTASQVADTEISLQANDSQV